MTTTRRATNTPLWRRLRTHPRVFDEGRARWRLADLDATPDGAFLDDWDNRHLRPLLGAIADHSAHLWHLIEMDPARCARILSADPEACLDGVLDALRDEPDTDEAHVVRRLRLARQEVALLVAFADLGGVWTLEEVMQSLSRAADAFIATALRFLLRQTQASGHLRLDPAQPEMSCGLVVLGLGKLGGRELNYSSDVDLMVLFDPDSAAIVDRERAKPLFARIVRDLVRLLQNPTADGAVLRVDLRLRPEPSASAVAISIGAAFLYYESFGQNWERAALIKARIVAGDREVGAAFLAGLSPFVWRKYFDFAAIADIHAMKRQIHAAKGGAAIAIAGHNVKLGRGGIRDIEFFVQTQQLIFGGKQPLLRGSRTVPMLDQLRRAGWISSHAEDDLAGAYDFLRRTEHRLQMLADAQTHSLPRTKAALERFAHFCGFASAAKFSEVLERHLTLVVHHYALLFEKAPSLSEAGGSLVFTGAADDPDTLRTLATLGYKGPEAVASSVRAWHSGLRSGVRSPRARETLTELVPLLLHTFARSSDPDAAIAGFDRVLERLPAAAELFAILTANASLRALFGDILGGAPRLAEAVALHPHLLDIVIDPAASICLEEDAMETRAASVVARAATTEDFLDAIRDFKREEHFLIDVRVLSGDLAPVLAGHAYAALAVAVIRVVLSHLEGTFTGEFGRLEGSSLTILAMGKLGSREMNSASDLDIILIYDFDPDRPKSDGARAVDAVTYYTRLTQRLISYLTVPTRRGGLYDVDMRLRPTGRQGPLATKVSAFAAYQRTTAETWEHMALTRARVVAGDPTLGQRVTSDIERILADAKRTSLREDVAKMRALVAREKPATGAWDLKLLPGGLLDIEFVAQFICLRDHAVYRDGLDPSTATILARATEAGALDARDGKALLDAYHLISQTLQVIRLALSDGETPEAAGKSLKRRLADAVGLPSFARLKTELAASRQSARAVFDTLMREGG